MRRKGPARAGPGKGKQDKKGGGKGNAKKGGDDKGKPKEGKQCPFFAKKGFCKKGAECDMVHSLTATTAAGEGSVGALPAGWGALSGAHLTNPFGAFVVVSGKPVSACPESVANAVHATVFRADAGQPAKGEMKGFFTELDQLPKDWWKVVENERGGYQYKTVTKVLGTLVET